MKKIWKVILIIAIVIFVLGLLLIGASLLSGGSIYGLINNIESVEYSEDFDGEEINAIDIDLTAAKLFIVPGDYFAVIGEKIPKDYFSCRVENGTLIIEEKWSSSNARSVSMGLAAYKYEPKVTLYVPSDFQVISEGTSANISIDVGLCRIDGLAVENAEFMLGACTFSASDIQADTLTLKIAAGDVHLSGSISDCIKMRCGSGSVRLDLDREKSDYDVNAMMALGKLVVGSKWYSGCWRVSNNGDGTMLDALSGTGNMTIKFAG